MAYWIKTYRGKRYDEFHDCVNAIYSCECSECGWHTGQQGVNFKFCPICGSIMENACKNDVVPMEIIDQAIAEMEKASYCDKETKMVKNCNASGLSVAIKIINKYCKENTK